MSPQKNLKSFKKDEEIFIQNDDGEEMYIIQNEKIGLYLKNGSEEEVELAVMGKRNFFGEMALMGSSKRTATARAIEPSVLLIINKSLFEYQLTQVPQWFVTMFKTIMDRLLQTNTKVCEMEKKLEKYESKDN